MRILTFFLLLATMVQGQVQEVPSSHILHTLQGLQPRTVHRMLYVAAHPDDENTRMISAFSNGLQYETAYLSMTRGDGGQNLIGPELSEALGVIRTQELMEARRLDGGHQFFTRAVDFGYSKNAEETFALWNRDSILGDVVQIIRRFKPTVIITRFPPDARAGHGHHTASALLAEEAFDRAADPDFRPELGPAHRTVALYWNASVWWDKDLPAKADTSKDYVAVDVGGYDPLLGRSYNELASASRSMHKSQGFGIPVQRGSNLEYLMLRKGQPFVGEPEIQTMELRAYEALLGSIIEKFNPAHPENSIPALLRLRTTCLEDTRYADRIPAIDQCIRWCLGLYGRASVDHWAVPSGEVVPCQVELLVRNPSTTWLQELRFGTNVLSYKDTLKTNQSFTYEGEIIAPANLGNPYWLEGSYNTRYVVPSPEFVGLPENPPAVVVTAVLVTEGQELLLEMPVVHRWTDRVKGELQRDFIVAPEATVTPLEPCVVSTGGEKRTLRFTVKGFAEPFSGNLEIVPPAGWTVEPAYVPVDLTSRYEEQPFTVTLIPGKQPESGELYFRWDNRGEQARSFREIAYDHLRTQVMFLPAKVRLTALSADPGRGRIGYIPGAGDGIPEALEQLGYGVDILDETTLAQTDLSRYPAVITGIRAYNTNPWLTVYREKLMRFVEDGGNFIVQYNTNGRDLREDNLGPYPFKITRDRVTDETARAGILNPAHPLFNRPVKIEPTDFEGWVQERGLYFAGDWDPHYEALISWNDPGEAPELGGLITCTYGKGTFTYTGISFFRQLPAGVPGAYKLLINLLERE